MSELPRGWTSTTLESLVAFDGLFSDGDWVESKDQDPSGAIRLLQLADVGDGKFLDKSRRFLNDEQFERLRCTEVLAGDVLIARMPDPLGRACVAPPLNQRCVTVVDVAIVRPGTASANPRWLMHFLNSQWIRQTIESEASGTTRRRISRGKLAMLQLPLPPLPEQKRIADKLDDLLARVDACRERLDRVPAILKRFRQSVLAAATSGELTRDWRGGADVELTEQNISQICRTEKHSLAIGPFGSNLKVSDYREEGVPLVFVREIRTRSFGATGTKYVSPEKAAELYAHTVQPGDLLITKMGDPPGDTAIYPMDRPPAVMTADVVCMRVDPNIADSKFIGFAIESPLGRERIMEITAGVAQQKISLERFRTMVLPLPSLAEQKEVTRRVSGLFDLADRMERLVNDAIQTNDQCTPAILAKAFRGELVSQDPNDEPAAALLARIAAQRDHATPAARGRCKVASGKRP
ncbi:MAG: restriction endonuclease subunit S [Lysobacterales bacterium]